MSHFGLGFVSSGGAVLTYLGSAVDTSGSASVSFTSQPFGPASSDRYIIAVFEWSTVGTATTACSVGGISATLLSQAYVASNRGVSIYIAAVPTGTTGTISVTFNGGSTSCALNIYSVTGLRSTTPVDTQSSTATVGAISINTANGGFIVAGAMAVGTGSNTWAGLSKTYDGVLSSALTASGASESSLATQTGRSVTVTRSGSPSQTIMIAVSMR